MAGLYNLLNLLLSYNLSFILAGLVSVVLFSILVINANIFTESELQKIPYLNKLKVSRKLKGGSKEEILK